jgi:hypothetical protein
MLKGYYQLVMVLANRRTCIIFCRTDQSNARKEKDSSQAAVNQQGLNLTFRSFCIHKQTRKIDQPGNSQHCEDDPEGSFDIHTIVSRTGCKKIASY